MPEAQPIRGAFRIQWQRRLEGWVSGGVGLVLESWALLPTAGPACALLHGAGAKQGSEGAIRGAATTLHFEVGSQGGILARAPLRGGQGIWKESRRVGLGGTQRRLRFTVPSEDRAFYPHIHSFLHSSTNADQGWAPDPEEVPVTTLSPGRDMETPAQEGTKAPQSPVRRDEVGFPEVNLGQVLKWELVLRRWRDQLEQRRGGGRGPGMTGWRLCVTGHQAMQGRDLGLDESGCQAWAAGRQPGSLSGEGRQGQAGVWGKLPGSQLKGTWKGSCHEGSEEWEVGAEGECQLRGQLWAHPLLGPGHHSPWIPIMCSRMRTLSARIFKASRSCCTPSPCREEAARVRAISPQWTRCPSPSHSCLSPAIQQPPSTLCQG